MTDVVDVIFSLDTLVVEVIIPDAIFSYAPPPPPAPSITLSNNTLSENAVAGTVVGELDVADGIGTYEFIVTVDPDEMFAISGDTTEKEGSLDYETQASHVVTVQADNGLTAPVVRTFTIDVIDVVADDEMRQPEIVSLSPANGASGVALASDLVITFDTAVEFGSGRIRIYDADDDTLIETFDVATDVGTGPGLMNISGTVLTINPTASMVVDNRYYVLIEPEVIDDLVGNSFQGFIIDSVWTWASLDTVAPVVSTLSPVDNGLAVHVDVTLSVSFNEAVVFGTSGTITLKKTADDSVAESWNVATENGNGPGEVELVDTNLVVMHLTDDLEFGVEYYVVWDAGFVKDISGNNVAAQSSTTAWSFTTRTGLLLLDGYELGAVFSLRKMVTAYVGNCLRIRRSSDNAEQNFGFVDDIVDMAGIATFVGAGSAHVVTWFDQSGNSLDVTMSSAFTAVNQPLYVASGIGGKPTIRFNGSQWLEKSSVAVTTLTNVDETSIFVVMNQTNIPGTDLHSPVSWAGQPDNIVGCFATFVDYIIFYFGNQTAGEGKLMIAQPLGWNENDHLLEMYRTTADVQTILVDGVTLASSSGYAAQPSGTDTFAIGTMIGSAALTGDLAEVFIVKTDMALDVRAELRADVIDFYGVGA